MASRHWGLLKAAGGQISLHSQTGRFLQKVAFLDVPHMFVNGPRSLLMSVAGEQSLHSQVGRHLQKIANLDTDTPKPVAPNEIGGELQVQSPYGLALGGSQF